ncbi:MAG: hypothetical protein Kow00109_04370 [Acidobacteriota bacterium]
MSRTRWDWAALVATLGLLAGLGALEPALGLIFGCVQILWLGAIDYTLQEKIYD